MAGRQSGCVSWLHFLDGGGVQCRRCDSMHHKSCSRLHGTVRVEHHLLPSNVTCDFTLPGTIFSGALRSRSCAVVSSSGALNGSSCQRVIDGHALVLRMK